MSDPATDPDHDLTDDPQDDVRAPRVRLGTFLSWVRILAGRRGQATVVWYGAGFTYALTVVRGGGPGDPALDVDPTADDRPIQRILDALG